jgi:hypothetical protein
MAGFIYTLCALTAFMCAVLLLRAYYRCKYRLLMWGGACFSFLAVNNALLVVDRIFVPTLDLSFARLLLAFAAMLVMLYGLIWDSE